MADETYVTTETCQEKVDGLTEQISTLEREVQSLVSLGEGIPEITMSVEVSGMTQTPVDDTLTIEDMAADAKATGDRFDLAEADIADILADISSIESKTAADIPISADPQAGSVAETIIGMNENIAIIQAWTATDIPYSSGGESRTIAGEVEYLTGQNASSISGLTSRVTSLESAVADLESETTEFTSEEIEDIIAEVFDE